MKCEAMQRRLLGAESPGQPPAEVQVHLDGCAVCRDWQGRLLQVEANVPRLPVPPSTRRGAFLEDLLSSAPAEATPKPIPVKVVEAPHPAPARPRPAPVVVRLPLTIAARTTAQAPPLAELAWRWRYAAAGVAAALLLFAFASWALRDPHATPIAKNVEPRKPAPPDPLVANLMQRDLTLVAANSPRERGAALTQMAQDLSRETEALSQAGTAEDLVLDLRQLHTAVSESLQKLDVKPVAPGAHAQAALAASDTRRIHQLHNNRNLIHTLVEGGIRLAMEEDQLLRADRCSSLAAGLATEIRQAAQTRDGDRAVEMGDHLRDLLRGGVARNLRSVRQQTPQNSLAEKQMFKVRDWVTELAEQVEIQLQVATSDKDSMHKALDAVRNGRTEVENAVRA